MGLTDEQMNNRTDKNTLSCSKCCI